MRWIIVIALFKILLTLSLSYFGLRWAYQIKSEGTLHLEHAWGTAAITREPDTAIAHIRGDSRNSAFYGLGFSHA